jgi:hypothetical protein
VELFGSGLMWSKTSLTVARLRSTAVSKNVDPA